MTTRGPRCEDRRAGRQITAFGMSHIVLCVRLWFDIEYNLTTLVVLLRPSLEVWRQL